VTRRTEAAIAKGVFLDEIFSLPVTAKRTTQLMSVDEEVSRYACVSFF
jgi:hypothetical protein